MTIPPRKLLIAGAVALLAATAQGCSQNAADDRTGLSLAHTGDAPAGRPAEPGVRAMGPSDWGTRVDTRPLPPAPATEPPALRRFAAMPRFKPHAPHVQQDEAACLSRGYVKPTSFIRPSSPLGGGQCMVENPFVMTAAAGGQVRFDPPAKLRCQMIPSLERWVKQILQPGARAYLGSPIVGLRIAASYACRSRNSVSGARLSEHGRGNAIDISEFHLADGRRITVKDGWRGSRDEGRFLRYVHRGACEHFSTVLGPNADSYHHDHLHFDLASHGRRGTYRVCK